MLAEISAYRDVLKYCEFYVNKKLFFFLPAHVSILLVYRILATLHTLIKSQYICSIILYLRYKHANASQLFLLLFRCVWWSSFASTFPLLFLSPFHLIAIFNHCRIFLFFSTCYTKKCLYFAFIKQTKTWPLFVSFFDKKNVHRVVTLRYSTIDRWFNSVLDLIIRWLLCQRSMMNTATRICAMCIPLIVRLMCFCCCSTDVIFVLFVRYFIRLLLCAYRTCCITRRKYVRVKRMQMIKRWTFVCMPNCMLHIPFNGCDIWNVNEWHCRDLSVCQIAVIFVKERRLLGRHKKEREREKKKRVREREASEAR